MFLVAAFTYLMTIEPTASLWDCGEFIASCFKLEVGHPPGNPVFMVMGRFFTLFAGGNVSKVASTVNAMSALASAFTILLLFWTITHLARKILLKNESDYNTGRIIAVISAGVVGALAYIHFRTLSGFLLSKVKFMLPLPCLQHLYSGPYSDGRMLLKRKMPTGG